MNNFNIYASTLTSTPSKLASRKTAAMLEKLLKKLRITHLKMAAITIK
jgi:hypothetical protein